MEGSRQRISLPLKADVNTSDNNGLQPGMLRFLADESSHIPLDLPSWVSMERLNPHNMAGGVLEIPEENAQSEYYSARSTAGETYVSQTDSTGLQSQYGATWPDAMTVTMNSGFAAGTPRTEGRKGIREGRERGAGLPMEKSVGRLGKPPAPVPQDMVQAMRSYQSELRRARRLNPLSSPGQPDFFENWNDSVYEGSTSSGLQGQDTPVHDVPPNLKRKSKREFDNEVESRKVDKVVDGWAEGHLHEPEAFPYLEVSPYPWEPITQAPPHFQRPIAPPYPPFLDAATAPHYLKKLF